ncbi:dihydrodipicolinate synthase family protein [Asanoa iriomotensis]|uniref:Dihydrodipicolinate synthase family protein n=1 Tax=Asanoa iriomotensis TaxID=234613 RepID=A0ABQ4BZW1_9ACTN|nr:dihydrodipicolinate synthase family protein [Asanoa iriomotensis]GIF56052.1 dihydrodipicolinate synthase family protein [Asanoa iriomotensis]
MSAGHPIAGVTIPLVTVLDERGRPDPAAAGPLLAHLAAGGVTALMLAGTNGEGPLLSGAAVRSYAVEVGAMWRSLVGPEATVLATAPGAGRRDTLERIDLLDGVDLDAVVVLAPFYFRHTPRELEAHFQAAAGRGRPIVVYNSPGYTGNPLTAALVERLRSVPGIVGLKDSSGDAALFAELCALASPEFGVAQGAEGQLASGLRAGAAGTVPGVGMLAPALCVDLVARAAHGDHDGAAVLQERVDRLTRIFAVRPGTSGIVMMKSALHLLGLCPPHAVAPFEPATAAEIAALRELVEQAPGQRE